MDKLRKKDKTVTVSKSGKMVLHLTKVQCQEYLDLIPKVLSQVTTYTWYNRQLNLFTANYFESLSLINRLYTEMPPASHDGSWKLSFTNPEAFLFWRTIAQAETEIDFSDYQLFKVALNKLHQKLL